MLAEKEPGVKVAVDKMREFTEDERMRDEYLLEEKIERDRRAMLHTAYREGNREGEERVLKLNRQLIAKKRFKDLERISEDKVYREELYREFDI